MEYKPFGLKSAKWIEKQKGKRKGRERKESVVGKIGPQSLFF
jgi:hypothetical protein